jgi:putative FmdB family regulatory protein
MPTYEFACDQCHTTARLQASMHTTTNTPRCRTCDQLMRRIYTAPGVTFKGNGWGSKP